MPFDARVIAATSRDLGRLMREGSFREDLFYRLNVLPIRVPPLRERREDIPALVEVLGEDMALRGGAQPPELSDEALALLSAQAWRGNIRELRNVLEQATMRSDSHRILPTHLEAVLREAGITQLAPVLAPHLLDLPAPLALPVIRPLAEQVAALEREAIAAAMLTARGNKVAAAKMLGISRAKLYERLFVSV
jgi:DNA-binding NtrC family response regulator